MLFIALAELLAMLLRKLSVQLSTPWAKKSNLDIFKGGDLRLYLTLEADIENLARSHEAYPSYQIRLQ